jgi:hypothetical protein
MRADALFASGSLDGSVVVWQADSLAPLKVLDYPEKYYENHIFTNSINHITVLTEVHLAPCRVVSCRAETYRCLHPSLTPPLVVVA